MNFRKTMLLAIAANATTAAGAATIAVGDLAQSNMTYTTSAAINLARTNGYTGVGTVYSFKAGGGGGVCTGSLINATTVITAAHCIAGSGSNATTAVSFFLPSLGAYFEGSPNERFNASQFSYNPLYDTNGGITSGYDVALITLNRAATGYQTYDLSQGNPLGKYVEVGTGTVGGPSGTNASLTDYQKRVGTNLYEYYGDQVFTDVSRGVVLADFDDGLAAHDVFGSIGGNKQLGIAGEAGSSPGDSGGPAFQYGRIATVTSFGVTGGIFNGYCGGNSIDPYNKNRTTAVASLGNCTNSSVGEIIGNTLVSYNREYITGYLGYNAFVPEPGTWGLMIVGFGAIGLGLRRKARTRLAFA